MRRTSMRSSKKSKGRSRAMKSSSPVTRKGKGKDGRSELHYSNPRVTGSPYLTQTGTYHPGCSEDLLPLRMTLISLLGAKGYVKLITGERSSPFSPEFTYAFFSELDAIRRRGLKYSEGKVSHNGPRTGFYLMPKSLPKPTEPRRKSSKSQSNAKSKGRCR